MKFLSTVIFVFSLLFCACNKNNEPELEMVLPITTSFIPTSVDLNKNDLDDVQREQIKYLTSHEHIVNNISDLPEDPIGHDEVFRKLNYQENTLLILYLLHYWTIDTYSNRFYKNTKENTFNWVVRLGSAYEEGENNSDKTQLTRFAILVKKLPENAELKTWYSHTSVEGQ